MRGRPAAYAAMVAVLVVLQGCDAEEAKNEAVTLDTRLAEIYGRSCQTCHENTGTGAPQTHNVEQWKPRLAQGEELLFDHMVNGFGGMPPLGQCIECSGDDLKALMQFMASPAATSK